MISKMYFERLKESKQRNAYLVWLCYFPDVCTDRSEKNSTRKDRVCIIYTSGAALDISIFTLSTNLKRIESCFA